jgi:hypothetical protein
MKIQDVVTLEQAMEAASESIANFKRFVESLDKFLKTNNLGSAEYSAEYPATEFRADSHGYDIAMFHLRDQRNKDVMYLYIYTDGTVQGENLSDAPGIDQRSRVNAGCTYIEAAREILHTVGVRGRSTLSGAKIDKAIEVLG